MEDPRCERHVRVRHDSRQRQSSLANLYEFHRPAFKCTCPSRKFPCKHSLGLFLILAQQPAAMTETAPPAWTIEWLGRALRWRWMLRSRRKLEQKQ